MPLDVLTEESIIELAKAVMVEMRCDAADSISPEECDAVLSSFEAYRQHIIDHYQGNGKVSTGYHCLGLRNSYCQPTPFSSLDELHNHVDGVHMKKVKLQCPFITCPVSLKMDDFPSHLHAMHIHSRGQHIARLEPYLRPSWRPTLVSHLQPPPLPEPTCRLLSELIAPVTLPRVDLSREKTPVRSATPPLSQLMISPSRQVTQQRLGRLTSIQSVQSTNSSLEDDLVVEDLGPPRKISIWPTSSHFHPPKKEDWPDPDKSMIVWRRPQVLDRDLVRPLDMDKEKRMKLFVPPKSIQYDVFKKKVEKLIEDGILGH
ncbi:hypothetical protein V5O48_001433 [Marasmius crinis-equi]|uniref:C2H2-type domain-containing protein n=1 Tax=Marasmius crinis-equi TaxID=585013 RepID=A0ABR3FYL9_9AGAR